MQSVCSSDNNRDPYLLTWNKLGVSLSLSLANLTIHQLHADTYFLNPTIHFITH